MEMSGQFHAVVALHPEKEIQIAIEWEAGWAPESVWTLWRGENLAQPGIEPESSCLLSTV
jgi:hypothetical protein